MQDMGLIRKALIAMCAAAAASVAAPASGDPAVPDLGGYAEDDLYGYRQCDGEHPAGPSHCAFHFKAGSGKLCSMVSSSTSASCWEIADPEAPESHAEQYWLGPAGPVSISSTTISDPQTRLNDTQTLPPGHKLLFHVSLGSSTQAKDQVVCGAGGNGSVSCQNAAGQGFALAPDSARTW